MITVLTPTYNRARLLPDLFNSLCVQSCTDFEWIVVDDGSSDDTEQYCAQIQNRLNNKFIVRYFKKLNGGKHTAINLGVKKAQGELIFIVDSDDTLPKDAIDKVLKAYSSLPKSDDYCGVAGNISHKNGMMIGNGFAQEYIDANGLDITYQLHHQGDMAEVFKREILLQYPFPEIPNERFCPEQVVWLRIAQRYKMRFFNEVIYYRDYLDGGLTHNIIKIRMKSPCASMLCYSELNRYSIPIHYKIKSAINFWRFRYCMTPLHRSEVMRAGLSIPKLAWYWGLLAPIGYFMHLRDTTKLK
jgi:glycosyltransferase involved in cell wall biosynthesis